MKKIAFLFCSTLFFSFSSYATIEVSGTKATNLWNQIDLIGKIENVQIIFDENNQKIIRLDNINCVFENYNACSIFVQTPTERKMIVALEGTAGLMNQLAALGVWVDEENARMGVSAIECMKDQTTTNCRVDE